MRIALPKLPMTMRRLFDLQAALQIWTGRLKVDASSGSWMFQTWAT